MSKKRSDILQAAEAIVCGDRDQKYGKPEDTFGNIAAFWTAYLRREVTPADVATMMILLKVARQMDAKNGKGSVDSYIDIAGYAACAGEIFSEEET